MQAGTRLDRLDGLRGIAALTVVLYHQTTRWAPPHHAEALYPFGTLFTDHMPFLATAGHFGVHLFFVTSGFVILMTLERSSGLIEFAVRRAARLWPAMLVCATLSTLIINLSGFADRVPSVDRFEVTLLEYCSSILFVDPDLVARMFGAPWSQWVEGVYWTLWAEVRFYILIALTWRFAGPHRFILAWLCLQLLSLSMSLGLSPASASDGAGIVAELILQPGQLAWFSFGLIAYRTWTGRFGVTELSIALASVANIFLFSPIPLVLTNLVVLAVFIGVLIPGPWTQPLCWQPLLSIGLASYPLYLFHERAGIIVLHDLGNAGVPGLVLLPLTIMAAIILALAIHHLVENPARLAMRRHLQPISNRMQARWPVLRFRRANAT